MSTLSTDDLYSLAGGLEHGPDDSDVDIDELARRIELKINENDALLAELPEYANRGTTVASVQDLLNYVRNG